MTTSTMLIKCLLKRDGGSVVTMKDGATYHFKDDGLGNHVASVSNADHIQRFMQIPEAYAIFSGTAGVGLTQAAAAIQAPASEPVVTAPILAAVITGADPVTPDAATETQPEPHAEPQAAPADGALESLSDADLRAVFKAEIGRVAPPKAKPETMIAQIEAIRAERGAQG